MSARRKQLIALSVVLVCVVGMAVYGIVRVSNKTADKGQCYLDKDYTKNSVYRNMYPVLFL